MCITSSWVIVLLAVSPNSLGAVVPVQEAKSESSDIDGKKSESTDGPTPKNLEAWWKDLAQVEPECSRAILKFAKYPKETVAFLRSKLKPLRLSEDELDKLLERLGSDDEKVWHAAFDELDYLDPRLAVGLEPLFERVQDNPTRSRLVEIMSGRRRGSLAGKDIALRKIGTEDPPQFNFSSGGSSWWAEAKVENLGRFGLQKRSWLRAIRATVLLESIRTPEARKLLVRLSQGHKKAKPTAIARTALLAGKPSK